MAKNEATRITKRLVDALDTGTAVFDEVVRGFMVRCQRRDKVYFVKAKVKGKWRWFRIGIHGAPWTPETARTEAKRILGQIADKKDPAAIREAEKANPTVAELAVMFLAEHVEAKRRTRTAQSYRDLIDRLIVPGIGDIKVADLTRADVAKLHHAQKATPYQGNRMLAVLSKAMAWAELRGYRDEGTNPCRGVEKFRERKRERFLSEDELAALGEVLAESERTGRESPFVVAAFRLLIFTGARMGEILTLEWDHVDTDRAMLRLPDSKTGAKVIYLSPPALETFATIPRLEKNPHVICGAVPGAHLVDLEKPWRRIRERATIRLWRRSDDARVAGLIEKLTDDLEREPTHAECVEAAAKGKINLPAGMIDVRIHDLRHSFASVAAGGGASLPMIGALLGHTQAQTTQRYAHLAADPVRAANTAIGERIAAAMKGTSGEIVPLRRKKATPP